MLKKLIIIVLLIPSSLSAQEDRHDDMLCNCPELHKAGEKDNFTDNAYAHDHNDDWDYYHFRSFERKNWLPIDSEMDSQGRVVVFPKKWKEVAEQRSYVANGTCDEMIDKKTFSRTYVEKINHTFSGSRISRATWEQLEESGVSVEGSSKIGTKGAINTGGVTLEGAQEYSVSVGTELHTSLKLSKEFEAIDTVSNAQGQEISWDEEDTIEIRIPPCQVGVVTNLSLYEFELRKYERAPHKTTCKYEGTLFDTNNHVSTCPQGRCFLTLQGVKGIHNSFSVFVRDIDLVYDKEHHIIPNDFVFPNCAGNGQSNNGAGGDGSTGTGGI